jgi:hypothetical protein
MYQNKLSAKESLEKILLSMNYDRTKTLNENKRQIFVEQVSERQQQINNAYCSLDANGMLTGSYAGMNQPFDVYKDAFKVTGEEEIAAIKSCKSNTTTNTDANARQNQINTIFCQVKDGIIKAVGSQYWNFPWEKYVSDQQVTSAETEIAKKSCGGTVKKVYKPIPVPEELKSKQGGVKEFQDWLVANKLGNELGRFGADAKFGKFTKAAWEKHKDEYLNKPTAVNTGYEEYGGVSGDVQSSGNVGQTPTGNVGQTPTGNVGQTPTGNQSNLEQMPMRDADYFNGYQ